MIYPSLQTPYLKIQVMIFFRNSCIYNLIIHVKWMDTYILASVNVNMTLVSCELFEFLTWIQRGTNILNARMSKLRLGTHLRKMKNYQLLQLAKCWSLCQTPLTHYLTWFFCGLTDSGAIEIREWMYSLLKNTYSGLWVRPEQSHAQSPRAYSLHCTHSFSGKKSEATFGNQFVWPQD